MNEEAAIRGPSLGEFAAVWIGGGLGALLRYTLVLAWPADLGAWPWHTFVANLLACAVLAFAIAHRENGWGSDRRLTLIGSGFCGGLSTFSALQLEVYQLFDAGRDLLALAYFGASVAAGVAVVTFVRRFIARGEDVA